VGVGYCRLERFEDALLLKCEFLDDGGICNGDFKLAAADLAGAGEACQRGAGCLLPGGREIGVRLDPAVAARGDQLGQHVGDFFWATGIVAPLLAPAASGEVGGNLVGRMILQSCGL